MEEKIKLYKSIKECNDIDELGKMFMEHGTLNNKFDGFKCCVKIYNRMLELKNSNNISIQNFLYGLRTHYTYLLLLTNAHIATEKYCTSEKDIDGTNNKYFLGFNYLSYKLNNDFDSKKYIAENMIIDIFAGYDKMYQRDFNVTEDFHKKYRSVDEIKKHGMNNSILSIIYSYDPNLADFISSDINILDSVKFITDEIINNFDKYEEENEKRRYKYIIADVRNYCNKLNINSEQYLFALGEEYGITDRIIDLSFEYDLKDKNIIKKYLQSIDTKNDFNYVKLKNIVRDLLNKRIIEERDSYIEESDEEYFDKICKELFNYDKEQNNSVSFKADLLEKLELNAEYANSLKKLDLFSKYLNKYKNGKNSEIIMELKKKRD